MPSCKSAKLILTTSRNGTRKNSSSQTNGPATTAVRPVRLKRRTGHVAKN